MTNKTSTSSSAASSYTANSNDKSVISKANPTTDCINKNEKKKQQKNSHEQKSKSKSSKQKSKNQSKSKGKDKNQHKKLDDDTKNKKFGDVSKVKDKQNQTKSKSADAPNNTNDKAKCKKGSSKSKASSSSDSATGLECKSKIGKQVKKIGMTKGAIPVMNESTIKHSGYVIEPNKLYQSEYSAVHKAKNSKCGTDRIVVKIINLTECSPRFRTNLLQTSSRILRYACNDKKQFSPLFIKTYDIYSVSGVKLFIFMQECNSNRMMYDLVKSSQHLPPADIRKWCKSLVSGVNKLQEIGVAHRAIKLQHIMFDFEGNLKLCGWSKAVLFYDPVKKRILLQKKERRVRRNYYLPPESFMGSYDPSKADIWSIGIILVAMCTKRYPVNVRDSKTKFSSQWREFIKKHELNDFVRNLCHKFFIIDPKKRIKNKEILKNKYFNVSDDKLISLSCKADLEMVHEDSRVGGVSAICLDTEPTLEIKDINEKKKTKTKTKAKGTDDDVPDLTEQEKNDKSGIDENATGDEGGNVGDEEEMVDEKESQLAEIAAPEEAEAEANPEDGETAEEEEVAKQVDDSEEEADEDTETE
ncbi:hypothetical protein RDWZM_008288 [Blomia tropicalis]|uniref:Protein kinase domain-containing protein n=1 Tax=Blomia tropicalis TaxID=40697 RepID=A0A9Q0RJX9_BLOTA|nr:hypothetical protein BLOT_004056 [Blomia tropicalis]KAJ6217131.1 hypothetical protein RDWZM_008288 [Blomia tropicalis]